MKRSTTILFLAFYCLFLTQQDAFADCGKAISDLTSQVVEYQARAGVSDDRGAKNAYRQILRIMYGSENKECQEDLFGAYAIASMRFDLSETPPDIQTILKHSNYADPKMKAELSEAVEVLVKNKKIIFLTPEKRQQLGGEWNKTVKEGYTSLGAYDCAQGTIYVDMGLRPFDLSATLVHELDHMIRDKNDWYGDGPTHWQNRDYTLKPKETYDWDRYRVEDEAIAVMTVASMQSDLQEVRHQAPGGLASPEYRKISVEPFRVKNDFTLVGAHGLFEGAMIDYGQAHITGGGPSNMADEILDNFNGFGYGTPPEIDKDFAEKRSQIMTLIWHQYFGDSPYPYEAEDFSPSSVPSIHDLFFGMNSKTERENLKWIVTSPTSNTCKAYMEHLDHGEVHHYLGTEFNTEAGVTGPSVVHACLRTRGL